MIVGSGNLVHHLHAYPWGRAPLIDYELLGRDAMLSVPMPEHYLPLLYLLATRRADEPIEFPVEGVDGGSVSMLTVQVGA